MQSFVLNPEPSTPNQIGSELRVSKGRLQPPVDSKVARFIRPLAYFRTTIGNWRCWCVRFRLAPRIPSTHRLGIPPTWRRGCRCWRP